MRLKLTKSPRNTMLCYLFAIRESNTRAYSTIFVWRSQWCLGYFNCIIRRKNQHKQRYWLKTELLVLISCKFNYHVNKWFCWSLGSVINLTDYWPIWFSNLVNIEDKYGSRRLQTNAQKIFNTCISTKELPYNIQSELIGVQVIAEDTQK